MSSKAIVNQPPENDSHLLKQQIGFAMRLCELEEYVRAESYLKVLLEGQPKNSQIWYLLSLIAAQQKQYPLAVQQIKKAIELEPEEFSFYSNLGNIYTNQKQYVLAIQYYQKSITLQPENYSLYKSLGFIYGLQGDLATANLYYAIAKEKEGDILEAIRYYQKAIKAQPDYTLVYYHLGCLYEKQQDLTRAIECYQKVTQLEKNHLEAYYKLGLIHQSQGRLSPAIYNYEQVVKTKPNYKEAYLNLSFLYKEQGNLAKAFEACQNAIQYQAETANSFEPLGNITLNNQQLPQKQINSQTVTEKRELVTNRSTSTITEKRSLKEIVSETIVKQSPAETIVIQKVSPAVKQSDLAIQNSSYSSKNNNSTFNLLEKELIVQNILDNKYNFIITAFFAENNFKDALLFIDYLEKTEFSYCLYQIPTIHQSASVTGEIINIDYTKPSYFASLYNTLINKELNYERKSAFTHILYLNSPLFLNLEAKTIDFIQNICDCKIDFAIYNWLQNPNISSIYNHRIEPNFLHSSGAIQLYSLSENSLLIWQTWQQAIIKYLDTFANKEEQIFPGDETFLDYVWNNILRERSEIKYAWFTQQNFNYYYTPLARALI